MKIKGITVVLACILLAAFLLGFTDTVRVADSGNGGASSEDGRLIGAFITPAYLDLFDEQAYFSDHVSEILSGGEISAQESEAYQGRLYATLVEPPSAEEGGGRPEYVFEGVDGIPYFAAETQDESESYVASSSDEAISGGHMAISVTDAGESMTLEGTIYVAIQDGPRRFYVNPVYQTEDGRVYATAGQGIHMSEELIPGMSHTTTLTQSQSTVSGAQTAETASSVTITVEYVAAPASISVIQLDANSQVISQSEYIPGTLPDVLEPDAGAEYMVVESCDAGGEIRRELYEQDDESFSTLCCREDGICIEKWTQIMWKD